jgi:hypothetical protein
VSPEVAGWMGAGRSAPAHCRSGGVETDRFAAHTRRMSTNRYEILDAGDGTFVVEISGGVGADATMTGFVTRKDAEDFIGEERRKLGIDERWQAIDD